MHVLTIPSWYPETPGAFNGSFFAEQAEALVHEGHQVGVLAVAGTPLYQPHVLLRRPRGVRESEESGVRVLRRDIAIPLPWLHALNQRAWNRAWSGLAERYISAYGVPDVLHAHSMFPGGIAAHALSRRYDLPFVITEHRPSSLGRLAEPAMRRLGVAAARASGGLIAVAKGFVPQLNEAYGLSEPDGWTYLPGLLSPQFESIAPRPIPSDPFTVGHVSHLDPGKRVALLIEAFADAFPSGDERLRIAGDSPHRADLERVAAGTGATQRIDFVGAVPRESIAAEFARYHCFVLPSEAEAFGTVLWEAMASGLPLISTATWAGRNAISSQNGMMVPIDDRAELTQALIRMRDQFQRYEPDSVRRMALEHCGESIFVKNYVNAYRKALQR